MEMRLAFKRRTSRNKRKPETDSHQPMKLLVLGLPDQHLLPIVMDIGVGFCGC